MTSDKNYEPMYVTKDFLLCSRVVPLTFPEPDEEENLGIVYGLAVKEAPVQI